MDPIEEMTIASGSEVTETLNAQETEKPSESSTTKDSRSSSPAKNTTGQKRSKPSGKMITVLPKLPMRKHTMRGTQTPLTLMGVTMVKPSVEEEEHKSRTTTVGSNDEKKTEISVAFNSLPELTHEPCCSKEAESLEPSTSVRSIFPTFRVEEVTVKFSHEAATQATPPHPSLTSTKLTPLPRDVLQIATSVCSNGSAPKSEVLTVTTDYGARTPDARSLLVDGLDQDHPRRYINIHPSSSATPMSNLMTTRIEQTTTGPPPIGQTGRLDFLMRRPRIRRWSCRNCIRRNTPSIEEVDTQPYTQGPPPTYSSIFTEPRSIYADQRVAPPPRPPDDTSASFVAPIPPPSYAQAQGLCMTPYSMDQLISVTPSGGGLWTPRPTAAICPRCTALIVTVVEVRRSAITHITALVLFLCGCWPCCLIPYCINSCKSSHHYCPVCRTYLGTYAPW